MKRPILNSTYLQNKLRPHNGSYLSLALCVDKFRTVPTSWFRSFEPNFVRISIVAVPICSLLTDRFVPSWTGLVSGRLYRIYSISIAFHRSGFLRPIVLFWVKLDSILNVWTDLWTVHRSLFSLVPIRRFVSDFNVRHYGVCLHSIRSSISFIYFSFDFLYLVLGRVNYSLISLFNNGRD